MSVETWQWSRGGNIHAPPRKASSCASSCSSPGGGVTLPDLCAESYWYPSMYPYHEPSGASVVMAGYLTSPSGTGCPSSSGNSSGNSGSGADASSGRSSTELGVSSSLKRRLDDLEFRGVLRELHEDYKTCRRLPRTDARYQCNPATVNDDFDAAKKDLGAFQQAKYRLEDCGLNDLARQELLAEAYQAAQQMSAPVMAKEVPFEKTYSVLQEVLRFRGIIHTAEPNDNTLRELARAHRRMADFLCNSLSKPEDAMAQYQAALDLLRQTADGRSEEMIAACLFRIATVLLKRCSETRTRSAADDPQKRRRIQRALELLEEAMEIRQNMAESEDNYYGIAEILIAMGDAHMRARPQESLGCYEAALAAVENAKLEEAHPLRVDALMAMGDCISGTPASVRPKVGSGDPMDRALNCYYEVVAVASEHHEQAMLKAAIVHFDRGEIGSALENLSAFLRLRQESGEQDDLAYSIGLLSSAACHFANFNSFLAKAIYEEARGLIAQLRVKDVYLDLYLHNETEDGVLPFRE